jgi:hypothetical protein
MNFAFLLPKWLRDFCILFDHRNLALLRIQAVAKMKGYYFTVIYFVVCSEVMEEMNNKNTITKLNFFILQHSYKFRPCKIIISLAL